MSQIKVYSTPTCPYCIKAKEYLKEKGAEFENIDVSVDTEAAQEMIKASGQMGVPVLIIDGEVVVGFDKARIDSLINA